MRKKHVPALVCAAVVLAVAAALLWPTAKQAAGPDANAVPAPPRGPTQAELQAQLQAQTEETNFRFKVSSAPAFFAEEGTWALNITNSIENNQNMYLVITLDETGEELYRSATLSPGAQVLRDKLLKTLAAGQHAATATAHVLDTESEREIGTVEAALTLLVIA